MASDPAYDSLPTTAPTFLGLVYPAECDANGHLNTSYYVRMFDVSGQHLFLRLRRRAGLGANPRLGWADVKQTIEYVSELHAGSLVAGYGEVVRVGGKSITTRHVLVDEEAGRIAARLEQVTVRFSLEARAAVPLEPEFRAAAESERRGE